MLSFIQDLRRKKSVLFIVATNFIKELDPAITREGGRFDLKLLVDSPSLKEKKRMFRNRMEDNARVRANADAFCEEFDRFVDKNFDNQIRYFTYSEWNSYVKEIIRTTEEKGKMLLETELKTILDRHEGGIALDQSLRDDYADIGRFVRIS